MVTLAVDNDEKELPEELKKQLSQSYLKGGTKYGAAFEKQLLDLFKRDPMSSDDALVAYYHAHA